MAATRLEEHALYGIGCVTLHVWGDVGVGVHRHRDVGVPETLLGYFEVHALAEKERGAGVTEVVEADVGKTGAPEQGLEASVDDVLGVYRSPDLRGEDEVLILVEITHLELLLRLALPVALEDLYSRRIQPYGSASLVFEGYEG